MLMRRRRHERILSGADSIRERPYGMMILLVLELLHGRVGVEHGTLQIELSRRITQKDRLIYTFDEKNIYIAACKGHYE